MGYSLKEIDSGKWDCERSLRNECLLCVVRGIRLGVAECCQFPQVPRIKSWLFCFVELLKRFPCEIGVLVQELERDLSGLLEEEVF